MMSTTIPTLVQVEHVLWHPGSEWEAAIDHLAQRFARVHPVDAEQVRAVGAFEEQYHALATWAEGSGVDLDRELGRFLDEHLAMHVRPDPNVTRSIRALAVRSAVNAVTVLGPRAGESVLRHAGCWRSISQLHSGVAPDARTSLLAEAHLVTRLEGVPR